MMDYQNDPSSNPRSAIRIPKFPSCALKFSNLPVRARRLTMSGEEHTMTHRARWAGLALAMMIASGLAADEVIVKTKDGATFQGEYTERGANATVAARGVETVIPKADIVSVERPAAYEDEFRARLAKLDARDVGGRLALAREAFDRRRYELARDTIESALAIDPANRQASEFNDLVQGQIRLERSRVDPATAPPLVRPPQPVGGQAGIEKRLLTPADVETIRRKELKPTDTSVRIRFDGDVKKRFADSQNMLMSDFVALPPVEQALMILNGGDNSMRDKVHVLSDPPGLVEYRRQIQPLIIQNCATIACHGGPQGGSVLMITSLEQDLVTYTNFYILQRYARKPVGVTSVFGSGERRLIDRGRGDRSLLANYGLPANIGEFDHPNVNGKPIQPIFRNRVDPRYQMVVQWMNESLAPGEPDYGIQYAPPTAVVSGPSTRQGP